MAESRNVQFFFGFCKFFSFGKRKSCDVGLQNMQGTNSGEENLLYSSPTEMKLDKDKFANLCITWANIFHVRNGSVQVDGWRKGRNITPKEDNFLPVDEKIVSLCGSWNRLLLFSEQGRCHVMCNVHDDWTIQQVSSEDSNSEDERKFSFGDLGESNCIVVDENGKVFQIKENENSSISKFVCCPMPLKIQVDQVSCGKEHVLLLNKEHGNVYSFGLGSRGQLGLGQVDPEHTPQRLEALAGICIKQISAGGWHSLALSEFGDVYAWGWNECGQLGITCVPPEVPSSFYVLPYLVEFPEECVVTCIGCGSRHSVAVTSEPNVWTWGWGYYGQLGHGDTMNRKTPTVVEYFRDIAPQAVSITCGPWQTVVDIKTITQNVSS